MQPQPQRTFSVIMLVPSWKGIAEGNNRAVTTTTTFHVLSPRAMRHRANTEGRARR